jgi:hypothetical protein
MPARHARAAALVVAKTRHIDRCGCALRLDRDAPDAPLGHAGFIHTF